MPLPTPKGSHQRIFSTGKDINNKGRVSRLPPTVPIQRLRISPIKVLENQEDLRIERRQIKPLAGSNPKAGGKADVEAATLVPADLTHYLKYNITEYVAVKKVRFDDDSNDNRVLAVSLGEVLGGHDRDKFNMRFLRVKAFVHEIELVNSLCHNNIVKIIGFVEDIKNGIAWMVFSWERNGNLREFVRSASWELPERVSLIDDVARGISYLHGRNPPICHGDLKSLNILVNSESRALITDFGSARAMDPAPPGAARGGTTRTQRRRSTREQEMSLKAEVAGSGEFITVTGPAWTIRWAAPELLEGELPCLASDIWAFGWICWEAVTGSFPFAEENDIAVVLRISKGDLPSIGDDAHLIQMKALCSLMMECWRLDGNERPAARDCERSIAWMDQAIPSNREGNDSSKTRSSGLLYALGELQLRNNSLNEARKYFQEALKVAKLVGDKEGRARALGALGDIACLQDEYSLAEDSYTEAGKIYSQTRNKLGFAQSIKTLGRVYYLKNEYFKSMDSYIKAHRIYFRLGNQFGLAQAVQGLGDIYCARSEYTKAENSYTEAGEIYSRIGNQLGLVQTIRGLGDVYYLQSKYSEAEKSYTRARKLHSQIGYRLGLAQSVKGLGDVYHMRAEYSKAEDSYIEAREIYSQIGDQLGLAQTTRGLGDVCYMQAKYCEAEELYTEARNIYSQIRNQHGLANSIQGLGLTYSAQGEFGRAEELYLEAEGIYRQIGVIGSLANILWYLGLLRRKQVRYREAQDLVLEASAVYSKLGLLKYVEECESFLDEVNQAALE